MKHTDLDKLASAFPEWIGRTPKDGSRFIAKGKFTDDDFIADWNAGATVNDAIFSALLDEIAEKEFGCYLNRYIDSRRLCSNWTWCAITIDGFETLDFGDTKLDALLELKK